jgi:class 3 adenylate cyclase
VTVELPETRYARTPDGVRIAFHVFGGGARDLLFVWGPFSHVELVWEHETAAHYLRRLGSFGRVVHFDKRGTGLSDRACPLPTLEEQMDDIVAVLDAVGSERAALIGGGDAGQLCILFAASHPERTSALVLSEARPRMTHSAQFPFGPDPEAWRQFIELTPAQWGEGWSQVFVAPSQSDPASRRWWARLERYALSPGSVAPFFAMFEHSDVCSVLPSIRVPTLVLQRTKDPIVEVGVGRYLAEHISTARFVEFDGVDHPGWVGATADAELDEIEEFLTGARSRREPNRVLATVLFTDIAGSTDRAAALGDRRWRDLLGDHDAISRQEIDRHRGRWVKSTGDGILATFDGPARAIRCAQAIADRMGQLGVQMRAGVHTGECEELGDDIGGIAVHISARVADLAPIDEVIVTRTVVDLVAGSGLEFEDRGEHSLKGVPGRWRLFAVSPKGWQPPADVGARRGSGPKVD